MPGSAGLRLSIPVGGGGGGGGGGDGNCSKKSRGASHQQLLWARRGRAVLLPPRRDASALKLSSPIIAPDERLASNLAPSRGLLFGTAFKRTVHRQFHKHTYTHRHTKTQVCRSACVCIRVSSLLPIPLEPRRPRPIKVFTMGSRRPTEASQGSTPIGPTYSGYVRSTADALVIFEACLTGHLLHVPRRPHDRERADLITSGGVYVYEEHSSGMKRWTDGTTWSPSRIMNNFLIYRQLDTPFPPGEKKRAAKKAKKPNSAIKDEAAGADPSADGNYAQTDAQHSTSEMDLAEQKRMVYGSLIDSYNFKEGGLVKKTISITYRGVTHHLVSYYTAEDVVANRLMTPTSDPNLRWIVPRTELLISQNFRSPVEIGQLNLTGTMYPPPPPPGQLGYPASGWDAMSANSQMGFPTNSWRSMSVPDNSFQVGSPYYPISQQITQQQPQPHGHPSLGQAHVEFQSQVYGVVPQEQHWPPNHGPNTFPMGIPGVAGAEPQRRHSTAYPIMQNFNTVNYDGIPQDDSRSGNHHHTFDPPSEDSDHAFAPHAEDNSGHGPGQFGMEHHQF